MAGYTRQDALSQGSPNLGALAEIQNNWGMAKIKASDDLSVVAERIAKLDITADATGGLAIDIPEGAEIVDVAVVCSEANASGTVTVQVGGGGTEITSAIVCAVIDIRSKTTKVVQSVKTVGASGIEAVTNGAGDGGVVYVKYLI